MLLPAAMLTTEKRSGKLSTMLRVLLPMEPVEPKMAIRFINSLATNDTCSEVNAEAGEIKQDRDRQREQERVNAVEHSSMPGKKRSRVLQSSPALHGRFHEIAKLGRDVDARREEDDQPNGRGFPRDDGHGVRRDKVKLNQPFVDGQEKAEQQESDDYGAQHRRDCPFPRFSGAHPESQLVCANGAAHVECGDIAGPDQQHDI